jgi:hypothetical protein
MLLISEIDDISKIITAQFSDGFFADENALHFASSALGIDNIESIIHHISIDSTSGLRSIIISPNDDIRYKIEPFIPQTGLSESIYNSIIQSLSHINYTKIKFINADHDFKIEIDSNDHTNFIKKLKCSYSSPIIPPYDSSIFRFFLFITARTIARKTGITAYTCDSSFINELVSKMINSRLSDIECIDCFRFIFQKINLLNDRSTSIFNLKNESERLARKLADFSRQDEYIARCPMELIMANRIIIQTADRDQIYNDLDCISNIIQFL